MKKFCLGPMQFVDYSLITVHYSCLSAALFAPLDMCGAALSGKLYLACAEPTSSKINNASRRTTVIGVYGPIRQNLPVHNSRLAQHCAVGIFEGMQCNGLQQLTRTEVVY